MENIKLPYINENSEIKPVSNINDALAIVEKRCGHELVEYIKNVSINNKDYAQYTKLLDLRNKFTEDFSDLYSAVLDVESGINTTETKRGKVKSTLTKKRLTNLVEASRKMLKKLNTELAISETFFKWEES